MTAVVFVYADWAARYPSLAAGVASPQATLLFQDTGMYLANDDCPVADLTIRTSILYLITAHLAAMTPEGGGNGLVGRLARAGEGSVNVGLDYKSSERSAWWDQTTYGAQAWVALRPYMQGFYTPAPQRPVNPYPNTAGVSLGYARWPS